MSSWDLFAEVNSILTEMGGKGSGHHGHKGVKGHRGGSAPGKGGSMLQHGKHPGGLYTPLSWDDVPDKVYHGTSEDNARRIAEDGIEPVPRGQGVMPLVSTCPSIGSAYGWGGGQAVVEIDTKKIPRRGDVWEAPTFDEIAFTEKVPKNAIKKIYVSEWIEENKVGRGDIALRRQEGYVLALQPLEKSDFIISQIESQLALNPEGGWVEMGGKGSGHHGHKGIKGRRGGSAPSKGGGIPTKSLSKVSVTRDTAGVLNNEWANNFAQSHGDISGPFENVIGEDNPRYYTLREKGKLVAGATTTRTGMVTFIHSIASHSPGAGQKVLDEIKKDSIFIRTQAATEIGKKFFERNGFIYDPHPGQYSHRWTRRSEKSNFIISQIESQLALNPEGGWVEMGGPGSGNWGHKGRKGKRGGSVPSKGLSRLSVPSGGTGYIGTRVVDDWLKDQAPTWGSWRNATDEERANLKAKVACNLSDRTGIPREDCAQFVKQWSHSSNDEDMRSLAIQQDVTKEFGVKTSEFTQGKINTMLMERERYSQKREIQREAKLVKDLETKLGYTHEEAVAEAKITAKLTPGELAAGSPGHYPLMESSKQRALLRTMYDTTQAELKNRGVTEVTLYRGVKLPDRPTGGVVGIETNPIESWSVSSSVAANFAGSTGVVFTATVPTERILSTPVTGFGCLAEGEVIVLGGLTGDSAEVME